MKHLHIVTLVDKIYDNMRNALAGGIVYYTVGGRQRDIVRVEELKELK